jgi:hypothetical protein
MRVRLNSSTSVAMLFAWCLAAPLAHATTITTLTTEGEAVVLPGTPGEQAVVATTQNFYETIGTAGPPSTAAAETFGAAGIFADGIHFQNAVAGYGPARGTSTTIVDQSLLNDTGPQPALFEGIIDAGVIGLWIPDLAGCAARPLSSCTARELGDLGAPAPAVVGGPAQASLLISLTAAGQPVFEISLFVGVGEASPTGDNIVLSISDGSMLNGFRRVGGETDGSLLFAWDDTPVSRDLGRVERGETLDVRLSVTTSFASFGDCGGTFAQCVAAVSCYGDPIGGGRDGSIGSFFTQLLPSGSVSGASLSSLSARSAHGSSSPAPYCGIGASPEPVPEPGPLALLWLGLGLLGAARLRRRA